MAFIDQGKNDAYVSIYVKHPTAGVKVIDMIELANYLAGGYAKLENPTCMYHAVHGQDIFDESEIPDIEDLGWVDTPAKLVPESVPAAQAPVTDVDIVEIDKLAQELLSGDGLSQAALMRSVDLDPRKTNLRNKFKVTYESIFAAHLPNIKKVGVNYFWKTSSGDISGANASRGTADDTNEGAED